MRLLDEAAVGRLRQRRDDPAFAAAWRRLARIADEPWRSALVAPDEGAGWGHDYFCPDHATRLEYDPARPDAHRCPVDGRVFAGGVYDAAWRSRTNHEIVDGLHAAALLWLGGGEPRHQERVARILEAYADRYPHYEVHGTHAGQGRCMGQSLDEAVWSIPLAWSYDLVRDTLDDDRRARIESDLLRPIAEHLLGQLWRRIHNIECWHLAGLATLGAALDDERFIAPAFDPQFGYEAQLREGTLADGWWWEGSPTYHFYTLSAVLALVTALRRRHPDLRRHPRLRAMFDAPLALLRDDFSLPATNDGWFDAAQPGFLGRHAASYELAANFWQDPLHVAVLARLYGSGVERDSTEALLHGPAQLSGGTLPAVGSVSQEPSGYTVLRGGSGDLPRWLLLKHGPHGGGHGHFDKLALDLHAFGRRLSADLGTPGYGIPLNQSWYRHTLSHNTVLLDETAQPPATGELRRFARFADAGYTVADAAVAWPDDTASPYAGVSMRRCILWRDGEHPYFVDLVLVRCPAPRRIDLIWHHAGELTTSHDRPERQPVGDLGYAHLRELRAVPDAEWQATWRLDDVGTAGWLLAPPGGVTYVGRGPSNPAAEERAICVRRAEAAVTCFAAVFEPFMDEPTVRAARWRDRDLADDGRLSLVVETAAGEEQWAIYRSAAPQADPAPYRAGCAREYWLDW